MEAAFQIRWLQIKQANPLEMWRASMGLASLDGSPTSDSRKAFRRPPSQFALHSGCRSAGAMRRALPHMREQLCIHAHGVILIVYERVLVVGGKW